MLATLSEDPVPAALSEREYRRFTLESKKDVSPNTTVFRFKLPRNDLRFGLPVGAHCLLRFTDTDGKPVSRQYTPSTPFRLWHVADTANGLPCSFVR